MLGIHPQFLEFLQLLENKEEGVPFAYYQKSIDFLTVLYGDGDCREYVLRGIIITGTDVLLKMWPGENENSFAGIEIWGGIRGFLSEHHREIHKNKYGEFVRQFNAVNTKISIMEILDLMIKKLGVKARYAEHEVNIRKFLTEQNPMVHIPLLPPERFIRVH